MELQIVQKYGQISVFSYLSSNRDSHPSFLLLLLVIAMYEIDNTELLSWVSSSNVNLCQFSWQQSQQKNRLRKNLFEFGFFWKSQRSSFVQIPGGDWAMLADKILLSFIYFCEDNLSWNVGQGCPKLFLREQKTEKTRGCQSHSDILQLYINTPKPIHQAVRYNIYLSALFWKWNLGFGIIRSSRSACQKPNLKKSKLQFPSWSAWQPSDKLGSKSA